MSVMMQNRGMARLAGDRPGEEVEAEGRPAKPSDAQLRWLRRGLDQPGGKLPLFDRAGRRVSGRMVRVCLDNGWAEPWFANPLNPRWLVCRLTPRGRALVSTSRPARERTPAE